MSIAGEVTVTDRCDAVLIYHEEGVRLYRYIPLHRPSATPPVLLVYALVNRPGILDLHPDCSLVRRLLLAGQSVYLIDWGDPTECARYLTWDDYVFGYLKRCVAQVLASAQAKQVTLLGICQGGVMALCFAARYPRKVHRLVTLVTPVDFKIANNVLSEMVLQLDVTRWINVFGNVPGGLLNMHLLSLKPPVKHANWFALDPARQQRYQRVQQWLMDCPDQAGQAFLQFVDVFFRHNRLLQGDLVLQGATIQLSAIRAPVLNIYAEHDHLTPPASAQCLKAAVEQQTDYTEYHFSGGHIGLFTSMKAQTVIAELIAWLQR